MGTRNCEIKDDRKLIQRLWKSEQTGRQTNLVQRKTMRYVNMEREKKITEKATKGKPKESWATKKKAKTEW